MSKLSRKFKVPDEVANLYDFANTLDVRHFTHHGVQHVQDDELRGPRELEAWMTRRGLLAEGGKITPCDVRARATAAHRYSRLSAMRARRTAQRQECRAFA